ncbi:MAG: GIY-YIG nuclease family protein [Planctomycetia bacterium]|nr:GIY-YIG nuclease family protein [Planctomycetia bacterium]
MGALFGRQPFTGFGKNRLATSAGAAAPVQVQGSRSTQLRARVRQECPQRPGIYGMLDARGELIYVGKAKNLRCRLLSYFRKKSRDPKAGRILRHTRTICWEYVPSEFAALLRELELIQRWRPEFNVQGQPGRRPRTFLCLGRRPAPYLFLTRKPPRGLVGLWGPIIAGPQSRQAARWLNDWYRLRDCPQAQTMAFADQAKLFAEDERAAGCLRYEIGTCLGPCAALCSRSSYTVQVQAARAFLDGADSAVLTSLEAQMQQAATELAFERAAVLHEKLKALGWVTKQLARLRQAREQFNFIYPATDHGGGQTWYLIRRGYVAAALPAPLDAEERERAALTVRAVFEKKHSTATRQVEEMEGVSLVLGWFCRHPAELKRVVAVADCLGAAEAIPVGQAFQPD